MTPNPDRFVVDAPNVQTPFWSYRDVLVADASSGTLPFAFAWIGRWVGTPLPMLVVAATFVLLGIARALGARHGATILEGETTTYRSVERTRRTTAESPRGAATLAWLGVLPVVAFRLAATSFAGGP